MKPDLHLAFESKKSNPPASQSGGGGGDYGERLAKLEGRMDYLATKEDIQKIKVWVLSGVLGGMVAAATITVAVVKLL